MKTKQDEIEQTIIEALQLCGREYTAMLRTHNDRWQQSIHALNYETLRAPAYRAARNYERVYGVSLI